MNNQLYESWKKISRGRYRFIMDIGLFMIITYGFHRFWWAFNFEIKSVSFIMNLADYLASEVYKTSFWINRHVFVLSLDNDGFNTMRFPNGRAIFLAESCSGLKQFFQIFVLFTLFPGPWRAKLWFIPMGCLVIHVTNIVRVVLLSVWMAKDFPNWYFAHDWIMRPMYYVVIFALWYFWNYKFRPNSV